MQRIWMRAALALMVLALPTAAHAGKPKGKPAASAASEASSLTRLKAVVDHTVTVVDQFIHDVKAAGDDNERLTAIGRHFQSQMQATEVEMEALQKAMDPAQRAAGEDYGRDKLGPRIEAMQAALELVQQAAEGGGDDEATRASEQGPAAERFRGEIAKIAADAESLQQLARSAGRDAGKRENVRQRLAKLGAARNTAWQTIRQDPAIPDPRRLFKEAERALEGKLQRVDRLLRLGLLPTCEAFEAEKLTVAEMAADARRLVEELAQVTDAATLETLKGRFASAVSGLDGLAWQKLAADERQELAALVTESISKSTDQFMERADALQQKFAP